MGGRRVLLGSLEASQSRGRGDVADLLDVRLDGQPVGGAFRAHTLHVERQVDGLAVHVNAALGDLFWKEREDGSARRDGKLEHLKKNVKSGEQLSENTQLCSGKNILRILANPALVCIRVARVEEVGSTYAHVKVRNVGKADVFLGFQNVGAGRLLRVEGCERKTERRLRLADC